MRASAGAALIVAFLTAVGCGGALPPPDPPNLAEAKDSLSRGNYWYGRGCFREAERFFKEGEISARLSDDVRLIIRALNSQGAAALAGRDHDRAANLLARALELAQAQPGRPEIDRILGNLGALAQGLDRLEDAGEFWLAAAEAASASGVSPAAYQASLARLHLAAGRRENFLALADLALEGARSAFRPASSGPAPATKPDRTPTVLVAGAAQADGPAAAPREAAGPPAPEDLTLADALNLAGHAALSRDDPAGAENFFREALNLDRRREYTAGLAQDTEALGELLAAQGRFEEAAGFLDRAFYLRLALGDEKGAGRVLDSLAATPDSLRSLDGYRAALKNAAPYRLDQRCP